MRKEQGFTLVELMITMVMFVFVIAAASQIFTGLLTQFKQQSKVAETNIEGIVGLDILRRDLESAGYGLPWAIPATAQYYEVPTGGALAYKAYNGCPTAEPCSEVPKAVTEGGGAGWNGSDELAIRGSNVARIAAAQAWTTLRTGDAKRDNLSGETLAGTDAVIVISPGSNSANSRTLVVSSADNTDWDTTYNATANFAPGDAADIRVIYGVDSGNGNLRMPFNRADYYVTRDVNDDGTIDVPLRCAPNTGVLVKSVLTHVGRPASATTPAKAAGERWDFLPLLDCVADMQIVFSLDTDANGEIDSQTYTVAGLTAEQLRDQLKDIRVYILAQEGQRDPNFTYATNPVTVGEFDAGRNFDFTTVANPITNWQNYRWKLYTIVVKPNNLR
jgi:prepilin-type N-terminal cleavage/methylation domain-containing protein